MHSTPTNAILKLGIETKNVLATPPRLREIGPEIGWISVRVGSHLRAYSTCLLAIRAQKNDLIHIQSQIGLYPFGLL